MNSIDIALELEHDDDGNDYLVARVVIDGVVFGAGGYATSLAALRSSVQRDGEHFVLTCPCGVPECARLETGVAVEHRGGVVEWTVREPGPERSYRFNDDTYRAAVEGAIERAAAIVTAGGKRGQRCVRVVPYGDEGLFDH